MYFISTLSKVNKFLSKNIGYAKVSNNAVQLKDKTAIKMFTQLADSAKMEIRSIK